MTKPIPAPNGKCFCGCGSPANPGNYFRVGHDKKAEGDMNAIRHRDRVVQRLIDNGYGPEGNNLHKAAIDLGVREACNITPDCPASGVPGSAALRRHRATHQPAPATYTRRPRDEYQPMSAEQQAAEIWDTADASGWELASVDGVDLDAVRNADPRDAN